MTTLLTFDLVIDRLEDLGHRCQFSSPDQLHARCVVHDDNKPSMTVSRTDDDRVIAYCHACGMDQDTWFPLFLKAILDGVAGDYEPNAGRIATARKRRTTFLPSGTNYRYVAFDGTHLIKQRGSRIDPETGEVLEEKSFVWQWWTGSGWSPGSDGKKPMLYRSDAIAQAVQTNATLFISEGEKDADRLASLGLRAVSPSHGADSWIPQWTEQLAGVQNIVILADDDQAGRDHAQMVATKLTGKKVTIMLPKIGSDVSDHLDAGFGMADLRQMPNEPAKYVPLADVEQIKFEWFWRGYVPLACLVICEGIGGIGKSTLLVDVMARVTTGRSMPDGTPSLSGSVLYLTTEDDLASVVKGRVHRAGADLSRVYVGNPADFGGTHLPEDVENLEAFITAHNVVLVIFDPWVSFLSTTKKNVDEQDVRAALDPALKMLARTRATLVVVRHWKKGGGPAHERGLGSIALTNLARSVVPVLADPDRPGWNLLTAGKANYTQTAATMPYRIVGDDPTDPATAHVEWGTPDHRDLTGLLASADEEPEHRTQTEECAEWLHAYLSEKTPPEAPRAEIMKAARADQFAWSDKVWKTARRRLDIDTTRQATERPGTVWRLPVAALAAVRPTPVRPLPIEAQGPTEGPTAPAQQIRDLQTPEPTSQALPPDIGPSRAGLAADADDGVAGRMWSWLAEHGETTLLDLAHRFGLSVSQFNELALPEVEAGRLLGEVADNTQLIRLATEGSTT